MSKQKGFLLPLAFFILIVMGMFAMVLSRSTIQTSNSTTLEIITVQSFYAAESGAYRGMKKLFFPDSSSRAGIDSRCEELSVAANTTYTYTVLGLRNCTAVVTCACKYPDNSNCDSSIPANYSGAGGPTRAYSFYTITSVATCGNGNLRAVRTVTSAATK